MTDPLLQQLRALPHAEPRAARADRIRTRCHTAIARGRRRAAGDGGRGRTLFDVAALWAPIAAGIGGLYITAVLQEVVALYGRLR